jgi:hypothetical protein
VLASDNCLSTLKRTKQCITKDVHCPRKEGELTVSSNPVGDWVAGLQGAVRQVVREAGVDGGACRAMVLLQTGGTAKVSRVAKLVTLLARGLFIAAVEASRRRKEHSN